ncbi:hypothetical protein [Aureivirga sp. CE67]|uniref:hypothetical protein n=1 Tax=Aureivirga sp. CE67 TaxID=1788983 RepID=UPI0018C9E71E|nr:hypothetical protein [Aureivirga sp. CE67]
MIKYTKLLICLFFLISCKNDKPKIVKIDKEGVKEWEYYFHSNPRKNYGLNFNKNGLLIGKYFFTKTEIPTNKTEIDSIYNYNGKGNIQSKVYLINNEQQYYKAFNSDENPIMEGKLDFQQNKVGWWSFYDENGILFKKENYQLLDDKVGIHQFMMFKPNGEIDYDNSLFLDIEIPKFKKNDFGTIQYILYYPVEEIPEFDEFEILMATDWSYGRDSVTSFKILPNKKYNKTFKFNEVGERNLKSIISIVRVKDTFIGNGKIESLTKTSTLQMNNQFEVFEK